MCSLACALCRRARLPRVQCLEVCGARQTAERDQLYFRSAAARTVRVRALGETDHARHATDWPSFVTQRRFGPPHTDAIASRSEGVGTGAASMDSADVLQQNVHADDLSMHASALYSFSMTIASRLQFLLPPPKLNPSTGEDGAPHKSTFCIYVLGARSEGSMPPELWDELLRVWQHTPHSNENGDRLGLELRLVGPEALDMKLHPRRIAQLRASGEGFELHRGPTLRSPAPACTPAGASAGASAGTGADAISGAGANAGFRVVAHPCLFDELILSPAAADQSSSSSSPPPLPEPDAFVLFNPGIAHPKLSAGWRPSLAAAWQWEKPMLFTSFDREDCDNDVDLLMELQAVSPVHEEQTLPPPQPQTQAKLPQSQKQPECEVRSDTRATATPIVHFHWLQRPHLNPFGSLKLEAQTEREGGFARVVQANQFAFVVKPSATITDRA